MTTKMWACSQCTLENDCTSLVCDACGLELPSDCQDETLLFLECQSDDFEMDTSSDFALAWELAEMELHKQLHKQSTGNGLSLTNPLTSAMVEQIPSQQFGFSTHFLHFHLSPPQHLNNSLSLPNPPTLT